MKKNGLILIFFVLLSIHLSAKNEGDIKNKLINNETQNVLLVACQHEYYVTSIGCDGFRSKQLMGAGTGDCGTSADNSVIRHNTDVNVCDGEARDTFLKNMMQVAVAIIKAI